MHYHMTTAAKKAKDPKLDSAYSTLASLEAREFCLKFGCGILECLCYEGWAFTTGAPQDSCLEDEVFKKDPLSWLCVLGPQRTNYQQGDIQMNASKNPTAFFFGGGNVRILTGTRDGKRLKEMERGYMTLKLKISTR